MGERKERGFVCAAGTVPRHEGGNSRFQSAGDVVEGEWRIPAEGLHIQNDFRCSGAGGLCQRVHDPSTRRRDQHGDATGRGLGDEAAAISESGRCGGAWNRRPGGSRGSRWWTTDESAFRSAETASLNSVLKSVLAKR